MNTRKSDDQRCTFGLSRHRHTVSAHAHSYKRQNQLTLLSGERCIWMAETLPSVPIRRKRAEATSLASDARSGNHSGQAASGEVEDKEPVALGRTPDGTLFAIPQTHNVLSSLFDPRFPKSHIDILTLALLALQVVLFLILSRPHAQTFFLVYFALWRIAYDVGLGYVLRKQSEQRWIVRTVIRQGWMDPARNPVVYQWIRAELQAKMGKDYVYSVRPLYGVTAASRSPRR